MPSAVASSLLPGRRLVSYDHLLSACSATMSAKTATATRPVPLLRKRIRVLERSHHSSSPETKARPLADLADITLPHGENDLSPPLSDYESLSASESSDGGGSHSSFSGSPHSGSGSDRRRTRAARGAAPPHRPSINTDIPSHSYQRGGSGSGSPLSPNSRAWYEFDLAVVVALVSPLGNWLTGTDHVKNLLLMVLLVFYLHQIIEGALFAPYALGVPLTSPSAVDALPECPAAYSTPTHACWKF